jgi:hypothetical protein
MIGMYFSSHEKIIENRMMILIAVFSRAVHLESLL